MTNIPGAAARPGSTKVLIGLCFAAIAFDGFDLVVYGAVVPELLGYDAWNLTPETTGTIGSLALLGMLVGALSIGYLSEVVGRRRIMIGTVSAFSALMLLCAVAPSPEVFGLFRFLAGIGLGGAIPTAIALTVEFSTPARRNLNNAVMFAGYGVGGIAAALAAIAFLDHIGFRGMMAIGGLPLVLVVPLLWRYIPESPSYLTNRGRHDEAAQVRAQYGLPTPTGAPGSGPSGAVPLSQRLETLARGRWLAATVLFSVAGIAGQTLVYGLNTWLPQLMVMAGYSLKSSLTFLLTVNIGAIAGAILSSYLADRIGPRPVTIASFVTSGAALLLVGMGSAPVAVLYLLIAAVGFGSIGAQILVNGFVATYYPDTSRASALGITLGLGRLGAILAISGGGWIIAAELTTYLNFAILAVAAVVGMAAIALIPIATAPRISAGSTSSPLESSRKSPGSVQV